MQCITHIKGPNLKVFLWKCSHILRAPISEKCLFSYNNTTYIHILSFDIIQYMTHIEGPHLNAFLWSISVEMQSYTPGTNEQKVLNAQMPEGPLTSWHLSCSNVGSHRYYIWWPHSPLTTLTNISYYTLDEQIIAQSNHFSSFRPSRMSNAYKHKEIKSSLFGAKPWCESVNVVCKILTTFVWVSMC